MKSGLLNATGNPAVNDNRAPVERVVQSITESRDQLLRDLCRHLRPIASQALGMDVPALRDLEQFAMNLAASVSNMMVVATGSPGMRFPAGAKDNDPCAALHLYAGAGISASLMMIHQTLVLAGRTHDAEALLHQFRAVSDAMEKAGGAAAPLLPPTSA